MEFLATVWLVLLHLVAAPAPESGRGVEVARGGGDAVEVARPIPTELGRPAPRLEYVRAGAVTAPAVARRAAGAAPGAADSAPLLLAAARPSAADAARRETLRRRGATSHRLETRGALLPYFPTAPPGRA